MSASLTPSKRLHDQNLIETDVKGKLQKTENLHSPSQPLKTTASGVVLRILCPSSKTDNIIGQGGAIISQIFQETGVKVKVEETIPGCDERVVVIASSDKETEVKSEISNEDGDEEANLSKEGDDEKDDGEDTKIIPPKDSKSAKELQKALLLVFERMVESEPETNGGDEENNKSSTIILKVLVLSVQVGCILGKGGSVIKQMSAESGAQIRILPRDKLPVCASASDELVQITGDVDAVRRALQSVSQQLLENPPRDFDSFPANSSAPSSHSFVHPHPRPEIYPPPHHSFQRRPYTMGPRDFHESTVRGRMKPAPEILTFRLLCHAEKVGSVIGKGGTVVKTIQQETGCEIKVIEGVSDSEYRIIAISGPVHPDDRISAVQDAMLRVQNRVTRGMPDGNEIRLLVPSDQIGCLLGKGGVIMNEMRKSSGAYIRIMSRDQIPKCASENEDVIQISGEYDAVQEALLQMTTRLQHHFFRDAFASIDHPSNHAFLDQGPPFPPYMGRREFSPPFHSFHNFDSMAGPPLRAGFRPHDDRPPFMHNIHRPGMLPPLSARKPWGPQGFSESGARMGMPDFSRHPQRRISGFGGISQPAIITSTTIEVIVPRFIVPIIYGEDGYCLEQIRQISDAKVIITEPKPGAAETVIIISGTPEQTHAAQSLIQAFVMSEKESS